jgi:hypothetical protein
MKRRLTAVLAVGTMLTGAGFIGPMQAPLTVPGPASAQAAVSKSLEGGGGGSANVGGAGTRLGDLLSGWAVPVITVLAGCLLVGALASRNIGAGVGIVVITLIGLIFLLSPQSIEALAKGIANVVF